MKHLWTPWRMAYLRRSEPANAERACLFCLKQRQADPAEHILYRGEHCFILLNRYPYNNGHLMVVPYAHVPSLEYLDDEVSLELMRLARAALQILRAEYAPQGFNIGVNEGAVAGAGVAEHVHLHIVPRWGGDSNYMSVIGETRVIPEWLDETYARLLPRFEALLKP